MTNLRKCRKPGQCPAGDYDVTLVTGSARLDGLSHRSQIRHDLAAPRYNKWVPIKEPDEKNEK